MSVYYVVRGLLPVALVVSLSTTALAQPAQGAAPAVPAAEGAAPAPAAPAAPPQAPAPSTPAPVLEAAPLSNQIAFEPLSLLVTGINLRYERRVSRLVGLALQVAALKDLDAGNGYFAMVQARIYFEGHAMNGFYLSPQAGYGILRYKGPGGVRAEGPLFKVMVGYNWIRYEALAIYVGAGLVSSRVVSDDYSRYEKNSFYLPVDVVLPALEFGIGYAF